MAVRYEIAVGLNKGHKTAKVKNVKYTGDKKAKGLRASSLKNVSFNRQSTTTKQSACVNKHAHMHSLKATLFKSLLETQPCHNDDI